MSTSTPTGHRAARVAVSINPHNQNLETVHRIVAFILNKAGCSGCGRLAFIDLHTVGDPDPELERLGIISAQIEQR